MNLLFLFCALILIGKPLNADPMHDDSYYYDEGHSYYPEVSAALADPVNNPCLVINGSQARCAFIYQSPCNCYEDVERKSLCCDYSHQMHQVSLNNFGTERYSNFTIRNARGFRFDIPCYGEKRLDLINVQHSVITHVPHDRGHHCIIRIHMRDSSVNFIRHAFEISLIRSEMNFLADAPNMQVLHITNGSSVGRLHDIFLHTNHSNIEDPCFKVEGSKITELQHIHASCPTILENSTIGAISNQLVLNSSKITNLQIDKIFAKGLVFRPGGLNVMKNVTISHCEINCLSVWNTVLSIANVNILKCDEPCIVFGMNSQLHTYNLFIENKLISRTSERKYIIPSSVENFDMYTNRKKITIDFANCNLEEELGSIFVCDLSPYRHQSIAIIQENNFKIPAKIKDHHDVHFNGPCYGPLILDKLSGDFAIKKHRLRSPSKFNNCYGDLEYRLSVTSSDFNTLDASYYGEAFITNSEIEVLVMDSETAAHIPIHKGRTPPFIKKSLMLTVANSIIHSISDVWLWSPGYIKNSDIKRVESFVITHRPDQKTTIINSTLWSISQKGIMIVSGELEIHNCNMAALRDSSIVLKEGGKLSFSNTSFTCSSSRAIVTHSTSQIKWIGGVLPMWLRHCISFHFNEHLLTLDDRSYENFCASHENDETLECDFFRTKTAVLLDSYNLHLSNYTDLVVRNASQFNLGRQCLRSITFRNISKLEVDFEQRKCSAAMWFFNTSILSVANSAKAIVLKDSSAKEIWPKGTLKQAEFSNSTIELLRMEANNLHVKNCTVHNIQDLKIGMDNVIEDTYIHAIHPYSFELRKYASLRMINVVIGNIGENAITIRGSLELKNVSIQSMGLSSVQMSNESTLSMVGVSIMYPVEIVDETSRGTEVPVKMRELIVMESFSGKSDMIEEYGDLLAQAGFSEFSHENWRVAAIVLAIILICYIVFLLKSILGKLSISCLNCIQRTCVTCHHTIAARSENQSGQAQVQNEQQMQEQNEQQVQHQYENDVNLDDEGGPVPRQQQAIPQPSERDVPQSPGTVNTRSPSVGSFLRMDDSDSLLCNSWTWYKSLER